MMFFAFLRKVAFWGQDALKKSPVRRHYQDIIDKEGKDNSDQLKAILEYAIKNVPFYKDIPEPKLEFFPVMNKLIYKEQKKNCISLEYPDYERLYKASTSGSTGTPLVVYQNAEKKNRVRADLIRAHEKIGWNLGEHYIFIRNWVSNYKQSFFKNFAQNVQTISISEFDDSKKMWLCKHLKSHKKSVLFGYASSVCDFMNYLKKNNIDALSFKVKVVVCDSDELPVHQKRELERVFGCPVINRYDNEENGLLAITKPYDEKLYINRESLYIELLKVNCDEPAQPGEIGRVVVTDLFNRSMPLIRYDVGDFAVSFDNPNCIRSFSELTGRKADCLYSTSGIMVSSVAISGITEIFESITKYQIVQEDETRFLFKYVGMLGEAETAELLNRLHNSLGEDADIKLSRVEFIPNGTNGKYKTMINKLTKKIN